MKKILVLLLLPTLFLLACEKEKVGSIEEDAVIELRNGELVERAFRGQLTPSQPIPGAICSLGDAGFGREIFGEIEGNFTHLGKTTGPYTGCGRPFFPGVPESVPGQFRIEVSLTGAHGDEVQANLVFTSRPDETDPSRAVLEGSFSITGGTGRFAGATGSGDLSGSGAAAPAGDPSIPLILELAGKITY